jgi:hypothetical protein
MRVSEHYRLNLTQGELGFVDIDTVGDTPLFIDPVALQVMNTPWSEECVKRLRQFFTAVLAAVRAEDRDTAEVLLRGLREPNETHLGLSQGKAQGRGLGRYLARAFYDALAESPAARYGSLIYLEEAPLLVEGVSYDIVSDIATNIIRGELIEYTQQVSERYGIPTTEVPSGPLWSRYTKQWTEGELVQLPRTKAGGKLLLVPKGIVRRIPELDEGEYFRDYILDYLQRRELADPLSNLVHVLKSGPRKGERHVYKKDLIKRYVQGSVKSAIVDITQAHPALLKKYRDAKLRRPSPFADNDEIVAATGAHEVSCKTLVKQLKATPAGDAHWKQYEDLIFKLIGCLFASSLELGSRQTKIDQGRKRIDVTYINWDGPDTFFRWLNEHHIPSLEILGECKNYVADPANKELDQLTGRMSDHNRFGFLFCPKVKKRALMTQRCHDAASRKKEYVLVLDTSDLEQLVEVKENQGVKAMSLLLVDRFRKVLH